MALGVDSVNSYFSSLISQLMTVERQPLQTLQSKRATLVQKQNVFSDLSAKLYDFQSAVTAFSASSFSSVFDKRTSAVSNVATGKTVVTASAASGAIAGAYDISVDANGLAQAQRVRGDRQLSTGQPLNISGTFVIGGAAARSQITKSTTANTVTAFDTAAVDTTQTELGTGSYYVETRNDSSLGWQFRLVDSEGQAVSIRSGSSTNYTSSWQNIPANGGIVDTGRGLTINLGADNTQYQTGQLGAGAAQVDYTAQGAQISIGADASLSDIAYAINKATYASGNAVGATIVDRQLVLTAAQTGTTHAIVSSDTTGTVLQSLGVLTAGGAYKNQLQAAQNASFSINGMPVVRSRNTGLTDVVSGLTINLAADAAGQTATVTVARDDASITGSVQDLMQKFNDLTAYLRDKTGVSGTGDNSSTAKYTRGVLADELAYTGLRSNLLSDAARPFTGLAAGVPTTLSQLGIQLDSSMKLALKDPAKFQTALSQDASAVKSLFQALGDRLKARLDTYTNATTGTLTLSQSTVSDQIKSVDQQVTQMNDYLAQYQKGLETQYAGLQSQIIGNYYTQQNMVAMGGGVNYTA